MAMCCKSNISLFDFCCELMTVVLTNFFKLLSFFPLIYYKDDNCAVSTCPAPYLKFSTIPSLPYRAIKLVKELDATRCLRLRPKLKIMTVSTRAPMNRT